MQLPGLEVHEISCVASNYQATWTLDAEALFDQPSMLEAFPARNNAMQRHPRLVLGGRGGELEDDVAASQASVNLGVGVESVVDTTTLLLVEDDLEGLAAILLGAETLANNLNGEGQVAQDSVVDGGQGARTGTLLLLGVAGAGGSLGTGQDAAGGEDQDMAIRELLLELASQACEALDGAAQAKLEGHKNLPLLDTVEALQGRDGDKDDNSLLAVADLDLLRPDVSMRAPGHSLGPLPVLFHTSQ